MIGWQLKINTSEAIRRDNILIHILFFLFLNKPCLLTLLKLSVLTDTLQDMTYFQAVFYWRLL